MLIQHTASTLFYFLTVASVRCLQQTEAAARGSVRKDDLVREIMANFGDTAHRNPMYRGVATRRSSTPLQTV